MDAQERPNGAGADLDRDRLLAVARVGKPHGVHGALRVWMDDAGSDTLDGVETVFLRRAEADTPRAYPVRSCRDTGRHLIVELEGVRGRNAAEALKGAEVLVPADILPELDDDDEFYFYQLQGLPVVTVAGDPVGRVHALMEAGSSDLLVIRDDATSTDTLIPLVEAMVEIDLDAGVVTVDPPEGLLEAARSSFGRAKRKEGSP